MSQTYFLGKTINWTELVLNEFILLYSDDCFLEVLTNPLKAY